MGFWTNVPGTVRKSERLWSMDQKAQAIAALEKLLPELDPRVNDHAVALGNLALYQCWSGEPLLGLAILERVPLSGRNLNPGQQACLGVRAVCHAATGNTAKARKDRDRVYSFNPKNRILAEIDRAMAIPARPPTTAGTLHRLTPEQFEDACAGMFRGMGFLVTGTPASNDGGIDLLLTRGSEKSVVQCKRTAANVGAPVLRDLYGVVQSMHAQTGYLCTTAGFTQQAVAFARGKPLELWDGPTIQKSIAEMRKSR